MLLQMDASRHDWLEGRGPYLSLVGCIDDATGKVPSACFREQEDAQGYFIVMRETVSKLGIPIAVYADRHSIFFQGKEVQLRKLSLEEQLAAQRDPTQFGRLMNELGVQLIHALSPQAKGRIERLWGTFQDRLASELRLAAAATSATTGVLSSAPSNLRRHGSSGQRVAIWTSSSASSTDASFSTTTRCGLADTSSTSRRRPRAVSHLPTPVSKSRSASTVLWLSIWTGTASPAKSWPSRPRLTARAASQ